MFHCAVQLDGSVPPRPGYLTPPAGEGGCGVEGDGERASDRAEAFRLLLSFHFIPTFVCSLIHLFCFDSPLVYMIALEKRKMKEKR